MKKNRRKHRNDNGHKTTGNLEKYLLQRCDINTVKGQNSTLTVYKKIHKMTRENGEENLIVFIVIIIY